MAKVSRQLSEPNMDTNRPSSSSNQKKEVKKAPYQPRSRGGSKALKTTTKIKKPLQRSLSKKASEKTTNPRRKPKKARGPALLGHYSRLNETLNQNEPEQNREVVEKPTASGRNQRSK